jgi:hypothetical protein
MSILSKAKIFKSILKLIISKYGIYKVIDILLIEFNIPFPRSTKFNWYAGLYQNWKFWDKTLGSSEWLAEKKKRKVDLIQCLNFSTGRQTY